MREQDLIYLDYNATTPCAPEVIECMIPFFGVVFGNPSSPHAMGRDANRAVEAAREQVANGVGSDASEIVFTSGATESNWLSLLGCVQGAVSGRTRMLVGAAEHKSIVANGELLWLRGITVEAVPVDNTGLVRLDALATLLRSDVVLVSVQAANNEVGTIQPIAEIARMAHGAGALVHCDAAQAVGKMRFSVHSTGVDLASFSGHKAHGPKGVGALFIGHGLSRSRFAPPIGGGGQEGGLRPGTLNVPGIVGMGAAFDLASARLSEDMERAAALRDELERGLLASITGARVNGQRQNRLSGTSSITVPGLPADVIVAAVSPVCISSGSACTAGTVGPSHVLLAMGMPREDAECTVRISLGRYTTRAEVSTAVDVIAHSVREARSQLT